MSMATDLPSSFTESSMIKAVGYDMSEKAARAAFKQANLTPNDVQVVESGKFIDAGDNTYGGKYVVNPSGGLISKGHPLGATGLAQCAELCWQLRGLADKRQVKGATAALQHNLGLGGAAVVTVYKKPTWSNIPSVPTGSTTRSESVGARSRL
jgi:sterol carrier protein 2